MSYARQLGRRNSELEFDGAQPVASICDQANLVESVDERNGIWLDSSSLGWLETSMMMKKRCDHRNSESLTLFLCSPAWPLIRSPTTLLLPSPLSELCTTPADCNVSSRNYQRWPCGGGGDDELEVSGCWPKVDSNGWLGKRLVRYHRRFGCKFGTNSNIEANGWRKRAKGDNVAWLVMLALSLQRRAANLVS